MLPEDSISLAAVGDIIFADQPLCFGFGVRSKFPRGAVQDVLSRKILDYLHNHDICIGNLESGLDDNKESRFDHSNMSAPKSVVKSLKDANFSVLTVANNHTLEHNERGVELLKKCASDYGVFLAGFSGHDCILNVKEHQIVVFSFTMVPDYKNSSTIDLWMGEESLYRVRNSAKMGDIVLVCMHWGNEFIQIPSDEQIMVAHAIIDAGATVVIGTHPHVLQPIETYGRGLIVYSLGNFITDYYWDPCVLSAIVSIQLRFDEDGRMSINHAVSPVLVDKESYRVDFAPQAYNDEAMRVLRLPIQKTDVKAYCMQVLALRTTYRKISLKHMVSNLFRFRDQFGVVKWFLSRRLHYLRYRRIEKINPSIVYGNQNHIK